jgi:hypothetical protein
MTPQEIQAIFDDRNTFTDTMEMTIGDKKFTLGDLRGLSANQQRQLSEKIAGAESRESIARDTATKAANLLAELQTASENLRAQKTVVPTEDDFDKEEFWGPVRKRFSDRDAKIDQAIKGIETLSNQVKNAASIWFKDRTRSQYEKVSSRLKKVDQYKDWDVDKVLGYATEHRIVDEDGMPSVERAILELTKANDIETIKKEAYAEGMKAAKQKGRLDAQPRPSSATGGRQPADKSAVAEIGLEGLGDDAMNDPELMEMFAEIQGGGGGVQ